MNNQIEVTAKKLREQLAKALQEQRAIQQQAELALDNARAAEHQILGGLAVIDNLLQANSGPHATSVRPEGKPVSVDEDQ